MSWAASGRRTVASAGRQARPVGSWGAAIDRARSAWDVLTGGPAVDRCGSCGELGPAIVHPLACSGGPVGRVYSDAAASAILSTAVALWADTAAALADGD